MKKIVLLSLVLLPFVSFAQFNAGQVYLGGTLSATDVHTGITHSKSSTLSVSPSLGYFISSRFVLGGSIGYSTSSNESDFTSTLYDANNNPYNVSAYSRSSNNSIAVSSFVRYYVPIARSFYFAAQGQFSFSRANSTVTDFNNGSSGKRTTRIPTYSFGPTIKPVFIFFPSAKWAIEASVGSLSYNHTRYLPNHSSSDAFTFSAGSFSFGLAYYFNRTAE